MTPPTAQSADLPLAAGAAVTDANGLRLLRARGRVRGSVALLGPAFVAAVAYIDPGNFATNFSAGAEFGYALAWVIVAEQLVININRSIGKFLTVGLLNSLVSTPGFLARWEGALLLVGYVAVLGVTGAVVLDRTDIT